MTEEVVVDTNVPRTANGDAPQANRACVLRCVDELERIQRECRLVLDNGRAILDEYERRLGLPGQTGVGDRFLKWVWTNHANEDRIRLVPITPSIDRTFEEYPDDDDPDLSSFDHDDRKFVAVAFASGTFPDIVNATDTDWWAPRHALQQRGINVRFLCLELMPDR